MKKFIKNLFQNKIFLLGLLLRLIVMPFTAHYDLRGINYAVYNLPFNHIFNVYNVACCKKIIDYIVNVNFGREFFVYPPLTYFTLGPIMWLLKPFYGGDFVNWINGYGTDIRSVLTHPNVFRYLFLMKIPYLLFDFGILALLPKFFTNKKLKKRTFLLWWLNPISIYLAYMWGQFDIIPVFFTVWSLLYARKQKPYLAAILLGVGAAYKNYPLIFLPLLVVILGKDFKQMLKLGFAGIAPFILSIIPFFNSPFFRQTVLTSRHSQKLMKFLISIGDHQGIYPFVIGYTVIFLHAMHYLKGRANKLHIPIIATLMWYYANVNFHQQWFLWVLPFLVLVLVKNFQKLKFFSLWILFLFFFRLIAIQANVTFELFAWIDPLFSDLPKTRYILSLIYDINRTRNIINSLYFGTALWFIFYLYKDALTVEDKE